jgi:hypothetical protein
VSARTNSKPGRDEHHERGTKSQPNVRPIQFIPSSITRKSLATLETAGADFNMTAVFYSQLRAAGFGMDGKKGAAFGQNTIRPEKLAKT